MFLFCIFSIFGLTIEIYRVNLGIQSRYGKIQTRTKANLERFSSSVFFSLSWCWEQIVLKEAASRFPLKSYSERFLLIHRKTQKMDSGFHDKDQITDFSQ